MADMPSDQPSITVGDLRDRLSEFPDAAWLTFGATTNGVPLVFYRVKNKSPRSKDDEPVPPEDMVVLIELNEGHEESP